MRDIVRFLLRCFFKTFKVRFEMRFDVDKLPKKGVYISNHVSWVDPIVLFAFLPGNPVFALHGQLYRNYWVRLFLKTADVVKHDNIDVPDLKHLISTVNSGRLCVIFPEGRISVTGSLMKVYEGAGVVAEKSGAKIIPLRIDGARVLDAAGNMLLGSAAAATLAGCVTIFQMKFI